MERKLIAIHAALMRAPLSFAVPFPQRAILAKTLSRTLSAEAARRLDLIVLSPVDDLKAPLTAAFFSAERGLAALARGMSHGPAA